MLLFKNCFLLSIFTAGLLSLSVSPLHAVSTAELRLIAEKKESWKEFSSLDNGFSVEFPKLPDHIHQKVQIPKTDLELEYDTYVSEPSDNVVYVVSVWDYPAEIDMSRPEINLQDGFSGMIAALPGSEVQSMKITDFQGFKSLDFLVKSDDLYFQGKLILVHNTLYQVFTVYKDKEQAEVDYPHFVNSFELIKPEERRVAPQKTKPVPSKKMNI